MTEFIKNKEVLPMQFISNENYKLFHSDCMETFKTIPDESIDLVVTDPPYRAISGGKPHKKGQPSGMLSKNDGKHFKYNDIDPGLWIPEIYRVLKQDSQCYIMTNTINMENYLRLCRETGFGLHSILCWQKNTCTPSRWYMKNGEFTLFLRKGKAKPIQNLGSKMIHQIDNIVGTKNHPTEKPVELMELYVTNSSKENNIVLDPFMGTGSSGIASLKNNRKFIGIEIDDYYYTAKERIEELRKDEY